MPDVQVIWFGGVIVRPQKKTVSLLTAALKLSVMYLLVRQKALRCQRPQQQQNTCLKHMAGAESAQCDLQHHDL